MINAGRSDDSGLKPIILNECAINGELRTKKVKGDKKNGKKDVFSRVATNRLSFCHNRYPGARYKMLQHQSILFAPLNFRTRLFYLVLIFAVLVWGSLCFLILARFVRRLISGKTRSSFAFCRVQAF